METTSCLPERPDVGGRLKVYLESLRPWPSVFLEQLAMLPLIE